MITCETCDMPEHYRQSDLYISATMQEGMSNAMLEAMASGLPIITSYCEGVDELISENGIIINDVSPSAYAAEIKKLAEDSVNRREMAVASRKKAENFDWAIVAESYKSLYLRLLERLHP